MKSFSKNIEFINRNQTKFLISGYRQNSFSLIQSQSTEHIFIIAFFVCILKRT